MPRPLRSRYPRDPYWITVKYEGRCQKCNARIKRGESAFYYPNSKSMLCDSIDCGKSEAADFQAAKADEEFYQSQYGGL